MPNDGDYWDDIPEPMKNLFYDLVIQITRERKGAKNDRGTVVNGKA